MLSDVLIVDDHPIVIAGIELLLAGNHQYNIIATANNPQQAVEQTIQMLPDIIILDLSLGGNDGIGLIRRLHKISKRSKVLIYSAAEEQTYAVRSIKAGAAGYLMKSAGLEALHNAMNKVISGKIYLSGQLKDHLLDTITAKQGGQTPEDNQELSLLSNRELQILNLIAQGYSTRQIAENLHLSPKTVSAHKEHIKSKLGISSSPELLQKAVTLTGQQML